MNEMIEYLEKKIGKDNTLKIMVLSNNREWLVKYYAQEWEKMIVFNETLSDIDPNLRQNWGYAKYYGMRTPEEFIKDVDRRLRPKAMKIAGGKLWEDNGWYASDMLRAETEKRWEEVAMNEWNILEMCTEIVRNRKTMAQEAAKDLTYFYKGYEWNRKTWKERRDEFTLERKARGEAKEEKLSRLVAMLLTIHMVETNGGAEEEEKIRALPWKLEAGEKYDFDGIIQVKTFREKCEITLKEGFEKTVEQYVKEGLERECQREEKRKREHELQNA